MYIKSMVLEGFKSYGKRIEINNFDKEFNAVTGFNGSGKSNILDAICFVLGITNLSQVRATSLQDLVYKSGQAGIQKATVTIIFDNRDRESSPIGYEHHKELVITRQIIIGGKNKYLINGLSVPNKRVQDLFCSVQLNVNNPHFLIMQGRITKVLNMKPFEILSMIEEASGTRMYETKKQMSLKTIEKKENKLKEINNVLEQEIAPKLNKLKEERSYYMEYQRVQRELEHYNRLNIAWEYIKTTKSYNEAEEQTQLTKNQINEKMTRINIGNKEIEEIDMKLNEMYKIKNAEFSEQLGKLEDELKDVEKEQFKITAKFNGNKEDIKATEKTAEELKANINDEEETLLVKEKEFEKVGSLFKELKENDEKDSVALMAAQENYQKISSGLLQTENGENATLEQQLINAKQYVTQAQTELQQLQMNLDHAKTQLNTKLKDMRNTKDEYRKDSNVLEKKEEILKNLEDQLARINYKDRLEELQAHKHTFNNEIRCLQDKIDLLEQQYPRLRFYYKKPDLNFKEDSVKGLVCTSLKIKNKNAAYALDLAAGAKLYNVIVDTEDNGMKLLERGQLQQRITIIPLNKIEGRTMDRHIIELAEKLVGADKVQPALSLIDFSEEIRPAMTWIFGQIFICKDMETAEKIAFHKKIMKKCVTLEGDIFDPVGALSGGAASKTESVLLKIEEYNKMKDLLKQKQQDLLKIDEDLITNEKAREQYVLLKDKYDLIKYEINMIQQRLQQTLHHKTKEEVELLKTNIDNLMERIDAARNLEKDNLIKTKELECQLKDVVNIRENQLKEAENLLTSLKKKAEKSRAEWQKREKEFQTLELEIKELRGIIQTEKQQLIKIEDKLIQLNEIGNTFAKELEEINVKVKSSKDRVKERKQIINKQNEEMQKLKTKKENITKQKGEDELEIKTLNHQIASCIGVSSKCAHKLKDLKKQYPWIEEDKQYFEKPGGMYDFKVNHPEETDKKLQQLRTECKQLKRNVNTRAINLLDKEEEQYNDMMKKKKIVENDKKKILETIQYLDKKKKEALQKAWLQVNKDFGSIFSSLLPGSNAKLVPPENQTITDGLEIRIGFSGVWKESLGELSGGQRSLVALSLILAMLLFKPAPLYILDEVDAALDLSHTENIGKMLKRHFKHSQFIVVSLKDGMFNNANVLFTTRFIDGMSTVIRTEKSKSK
ncbi:PREDICTED: structural maintenance of chromosomes protein 2 [Polistes dominula]|uniref:Structural maintenance of chromosomes protein n=1 Tax=Polistes dominula TaxID=743375 RepID=A0ABM1J9J9_POLDO|nr:PREDICTED: structural maintenance of chromosomes protein 2 [Polistes dominula]